MATREEIEQFVKLKTIITIPDFETDPESVKEMYLSNIIQRVVNVDIDDIGLNEVYAGSVDDGGTTHAPFPAYSKRVDIYTEDEPLKVKFVDQWGNDMVEFYIPKGMWIPLDIVADGVTVTCKTAGQSTNYQVVVWW